MKLYKFVHHEAAELSQEVLELAGRLRQVASDLEKGEVRQLVVTLIRPDGTVERLGTPTSTP